MPERHELRDGVAVADLLEAHRRDQGRRLGLVELEAPGQALLGEEADLVELELLDFPRREVEAPPPAQAGGDAEPATGVVSGPLCPAQSEYAR